MSKKNNSAEQKRLDENAEKAVPLELWGPYLSERQWGTVREDYSANGDAWNHITHDHARSKAYRWGEDGLAGISDVGQNLCFAIALWNGKDPILKERIFGLNNSEGNHGEDGKELYYYLDNTPTHSYMKFLYKYPQNEFPYSDLLNTNRNRSKQEPEYELIDTGIFKENKYFDVLDNKLTCQVGTSMANQIKYIKDTGIVTRLILGNKNYKVLGVDNVTNVINNSGIITIKLDSDISIEGDDFVNGIAKNVMDEVIIIPPVLDLYTLVTSTTATNSDFINLGLTRYQKVVNADWAVCNKGEIFVFSLEQSDKNPLINPNQLVTSMTGIQNTQCILTANNVGIRGYFFIVATFGNIIIKRELRVKAISDI